MAHTIFEIEMIKGVIEAKLGDKLVLFNLAEHVAMDANAGHEITVPKTAYIGAAEDVAELANIPMADLVQSTQTVQVKKAGKGMQFSVEQIQNAYIDVNAEAEKQLVAAINDKLEKDLFDLLDASTHKVSVPALDIASVADGLAEFGEVDEPAYFIVNPKTMAGLRKEADFVANANHAGDIKNAGSIFECPVVVSNRVPEGKAFLVKAGALAVYLKADTVVEADKDIVKQAETIVATKHYAVAINDEAKFIVLEVAEA